MMDSIIKDQFLDMKRKFCDELIKKYQKEYDNEYFKTKSPNDKIICQICGGNYTRHSKSKHDKTKKHQRRLNDIYEYICHPINEK